MKWEDILKVSTRDARGDVERFAPELIYEGVLDYFRDNGFIVVKKPKDREASFSRYDWLTNLHFVYPKKNMKELTEGEAYFYTRFFRELELGFGKGRQKGLILAGVPTNMNMGFFNLRLGDEMKGVRLGRNTIRIDGGTYKDYLSDAKRAAEEYMKNWEIAYKEFVDRDGFNRFKRGGPKGTTRFNRKK